MKVLHVGGQRDDAEAVATALRDIAPNIVVSWTTRLDQASKWIDQNPDLAVLVVEPQTDPASWRPVLRQARGLASHPLVVVVRPVGAGPQYASLERDADEFLTKNQSLVTDLRTVVGRRIVRCSQTQTMRPVPVVVVDEDLHDAFGMTTIDDEQVIETLVANGPEPALAEGVASLRGGL